MIMIGKSIHQIWIKEAEMYVYRGTWWPSGKDSGAILHVPAYYLCHVLSLSKTLPNMTDKVLTGRFNHNSNKQNNINFSLPELKTHR